MFKSFQLVCYGPVFFLLFVEFPDSNIGYKKLCSVIIYLLSVAVIAVSTLRIVKFTRKMNV